MKRYAVCHKQCHDGLAGAWVAKKYIPDVNVFFTSRKDEWKELLNPQILEGDFVYFIDYAPSPSDLEDLQKRNVGFQVLDHHATDFNRIQTYDSMNNTNLLLFCKYDMQKAGCQVAWDYFEKSEPLPKLLEYIAIADIYAWRSDLDHFVVQYIRTIMEPDATVEDFDRFKNSFNEIESQKLGEIIYKRITKDVHFVAKRANLMDFDETTVLAVNSAHYHSEIGHELTLGSPSGLGIVYTYFPANDGVKLSVRGTGANAFCEKFDGGGHPQAAGCYMTIEQFSKYLKTARKNTGMEV